MVKKGVYDPNVFVSNPGSPIRSIFKPKVNSDGTIKLVEIGKENIQDIINSNVHQCDMSYIMDSLRNGDDSVLNRGNPGFYGDVTNLPKNHSEILQLMIDSRDQFESLPQKVRAEYNNNFDEWFASIGSFAWFTKMGITPDVKENEFEDKELKDNEP